MSLRVMTNVWDNFPGSGSELLAMLALADWCNDAGGSLHPSIAGLAKKIRTSESQARRVLHGLIQKGWVSVVGNWGGGAPGQTRDYQINLAMLAEFAAGTGSAHATPSASATPRICAQDGSHPCAETGGTRATRTVSKPKATTNKSKRVAAPVAELDLSAWPSRPSPQVLADWLAHRKSRRAAVTPTVIAAFGRQLELAGAMGFSVDHCLATCCTRNWQGFEAAWLARDLTTSSPHGARNAAPVRSTSLSAVERVHRNAQRMLDAEQRASSGPGVLEGHCYAMGSHD